MSSFYFIASLVFLFGGFIASRFLSERSLRLLSSEEKLTLLDSFSSLRAFGSIPLILLVCSFFALPHLPSRFIPLVFFTICLIIALWFAALHIYVSRRLRQLFISPAYQKAHFRARLCSYIGWLGFFIFNTLNWLHELA
jgi:hypothetical protein